MARSSEIDHWLDIEVLLSEETREEKSTLSSKGNLENSKNQLCLFTDDSRLIISSKTEAELEMVVPSIEQIEHSFGATHPGVYDAEKHLFVLNFRGLSFSFHVDTQFQAGHTQGLGSLQFASGSSPCVSCTSIYSGQNLLECSAPPLPLSCYYAQLYLNYADVLRDNDRTKGLRLYLYTEVMSSRKKRRPALNQPLSNQSRQGGHTLVEAHKNP
ncbi:hypothetical protein J6590_066713 [Homalodisca vitripennis]|nr:hypothetical protein J6590_066713 [Homalodisca vitripennis]